MYFTHNSCSWIAFPREDGRLHVFRYRNCMQITYVQQFRYKYIYKGMDIYISIRVLQLCIAERFHIWVSSSSVVFWPKVFIIQLFSITFLAVFIATVLSEPVPTSVELSCCTSTWSRSPLKRSVAAPPPKWSFLPADAFRRVARKKPAEFEFGPKQVPACVLLFSYLHILISV